ncbi:GrlR family regulatory protein [Halomonas sp. TP35]
MKNGLYVVSFRSQVAEGSGGVVTVKDGSVNGGDLGYVYQGHIRQEDGKNVTATIEVNRYNNNSRSIFGQATNFNLLLQGTAEQESFSINGNVEGQPAQKIQITGRYLRDLV